MEFMLNYNIPIIVANCLCIGYILKTLISSDKINKFIPLILGTVGVLLNIWINKNINPTILVEGMFSGLSSTGLHQIFKQFIDKK